MSRSMVVRGLAAPAALAFLFIVPTGPGPLTAAGQEPAASLADALEWRNIGPANMAGRVVDIDAVESNFATVIVAAASGGVWKSTSAGTVWEPISSRRHAR